MQTSHSHNARHQYKCHARWFYMPMLRKSSPSSSLLSWWYRERSWFMCSQRLSSCQVTHLVSPSGKYRVICQKRSQLIHAIGHSFHILTSASHHGWELSRSLVDYIYISSAASNPKLNTDGSIQHTAGAASTLLAETSGTAVPAIQEAYKTLNKDQTVQWCTHHDFNDRVGQSEHFSSGCIYWNGFIVSSRHE